MAIIRIAQDLPNRNKVKLLNDMILELNGKFEQSIFDKNELDTIYDTMIGSRKFLRSVALGNTVATYTDWSHLQAETGFSIWKLTPSNYTFNSLNRVYMNNVVFENRGEVTSEASVAFENTFLFNGDSGTGFIDNTAEAGTEQGTEFDINDTTEDFLYLGADATFGGVKFEWKTRGSNYTLKLEYYTGTEWLEITSNNDNLEDGTNNFQSDGHITYTIPTNWNTTAINSQTRYWIRISTSTNPITTAQAYLIIPATSVIGVLALSSTEIQNEEWAWCTFSGSIYATIPNSGATASEGTTFITSSSSTTNLQNFFVYNKPFTSDYEDSRFDPTREVTADYSILDTDGVILVDSSSATATVTVTLPAAHTRNGMEFIVKKVDAGPNNVDIATESGSTIDGASTKTISSQYDFFRVISDNGNWYVIGGGSL